MNVDFESTVRPPYTNIKWCRDTKSVTVSGGPMDSPHYVHKSAYQPLLELMLKEEVPIGLLSSIDLGIRINSFLKTNQYNVDGGIKSL